MRLIDADKLRKCAIPCEIHNGALTDLCVPLYQIDNAPTVEKRKQGMWVCGNILKLDYYCSECRATGEPCQPYCAWCGARMKEVNSNG